MFLEITTRSFDIKISKGDKLNQMRLRKKSNNYKCIALSGIWIKNTRTNCRSNG